MPAAISRTITRDPNQLTRFTWHEEMPNQHVLALADPAMGLDDEILGTWYLHPTTDLLEEMALMVRYQVERLGLTNDQVLFYGSSLGGFGALGMASLLPGSSAISEIPQIDIARWPIAGAIRAIESRIIGMPFDQFRISYPEMVDVRDRFGKSNLIPPFLLVTNESDTSLEIHKEFMEDVNTSNLPKVGQQQLMLTDKASGHKALSRNLALSLIQNWSENAELRDQESCEFELAG